MEIALIQLAAVVRRQSLVTFGPPPRVNIDALVQRYAVE